MAITEQTLVERLRTRARIRNQIRAKNAQLKSTAKDLNDYQVDRDKIADLCDEAAYEIERLEKARDYYSQWANTLL